MPRKFRTLDGAIRAEMRKVAIRLDRSSYFIEPYRAAYAAAEGGDRFYGSRDWRADRMVASGVKAAGARVWKEFSQLT